jgi:hypothetical protein
MLTLKSDLKAITGQTKNRLHSITQAKKEKWQLKLWETVVHTQFSFIKPVKVASKNVNNKIAVTSN